MADWFPAANHMLQIQLNSDSSATPVLRSATPAQESAETTSNNTRSKLMTPNLQPEDKWATEHQLDEILAKMEEFLQIDQLKLHFPYSDEPIKDNNLSSSLKEYQVP